MIDIFNKKSASHTRDVDLLSTMYDFVYSNWVNNRFINESNPDKIFRNYSLSYKFPDYKYSKNQFFHNYMTNDNTNIIYNNQTYKMLPDHTLVPVSVENPYDKEVILLADKLKDIDLENIDINDLSDTIKNILPLLNSYKDPFIDNIIKNLIPMVKPARVKTTRKPIDDLLYEYESLLTADFDRYPREYNSDCITARYSIKRMSFLYRTINRAKALLKTMNDFPEKSYQILQSAQHLKNNYLPALEEALFKNIISLQKYVGATSIQVDPDINKKLEDYIFHYNFIKNRNYLPTEYQEILDTGHVATTKRFDIEEQQRKIREQATQFIIDNYKDYRSNLDKLIADYVANINSDYLLAEDYRFKFRYLKDSIIRVFGDSLLVGRTEAVNRIKLLINEIDIYLNALDLNVEKFKIDERENVKNHYMIYKMLMVILTKYSANPDKVVSIMEACMLDDMAYHKVIANYEIIPDIALYKDIFGDKTTLKALEPYTLYNKDLQTLFNTVTTVLDIILDAYCKMLSEKYK